MIKLITFALTLSVFSAQVYAQSFMAPDILVETRLDSDWSGLLVNKIRRLMKNFGQQDPFTQRFEQPILVSEAKVGDYLNPSAKELLKDLSRMLKMDFLNAQTQVTIHGLRYDVRGFKTEFNATEDKIEGLSVSSNFSASKIMVSADKVTLSLLIPGKNSLPFINIEIMKPVITAAEEKLINFIAKIQLRNTNETFKLLLEDSDFTSMVSSLVGSSGSIKLDFQSIVVPNVSIKIGHQQVKFDPKKIEDLIRSKKDGIKGLLIGQVSSLLNGGMGGDMLKAMNNIEFAKEYWIDSSTIQSQLKIDSFTSPDIANLVEVQMSGDFCPPALYQTVGKKCIHNKVTQPIASRITKKVHANSLQTMRSLIDQGNANIVVSISEDYVNKVLIATYDAGLWNDMLKKSGVMLGPNKVFIRMDEVGSNTGSLYMDVIYTPKKLERLAIGAKQVRFPLVFKVGLKIKQDNLIPTFIIHIAELDTSDETLLNGKPEMGVVSNLYSLRLKKKVLATLRAETAGLENTDVLELQYPEFRGLDLDKVSFVSDGYGRMNALILLKDDETRASPVSGQL
jgi:hypothetical protein